MTAASEDIGHGGLRRWLEDLRRDWAVFDPSFEEFCDLGDGQYLRQEALEVAGRLRSTPMIEG